MPIRQRFLLRLTAASAVLALLVTGAVAGGSPAQPDPAPHLMIVPHSAQGVAALERSTARRVARYEAFTLVEARGEDVDRLRRAGADRRDDMREVRLATGALDPARERRSLADKGDGRARGLALVQFVGPVKERWLDLLRDTGARIVTYQAQNAYLVHGSAAELETVAALVGRDPAVRAAVPVEAGDKIEGDAGRSGHRRVALFTVAGEAGSAARTRANRAGRELRGESVVGGLRTQYLELDGAQASSLAGDPGVVAVEPYVEPELRDERAAQIVAGNLTGGTPNPPGYLTFLTGEGFTASTFDFGVDVTDEGLDSGSTSTVHPDFSGRVDYVSDWTSDANGVDCGGHGTNVASIATGINEGTGSSGPTAVEDAAGYNYGLGVAPRGQVGASKIFNCAGNFQLAGGKTFSDLTSSAYANGARVSNNSWGSDDQGDYNADSREYDALVRDAQPATSDFPAAGNQGMVEVFAAGNDGATGYNTVGTPATAKNVITVGASESVRPAGTDGCNVSDSGANDARDIIGFSSRGPADDGRLKPELVAPGTHVTGAAPQHGSYNGSGTCDQHFPTGGTLYSLVSGTSQATPEVSGAAALVRDWYRREHGGGTVAPSPALTKAILTNAATDIAGGNSGKGSTIGGLPNTDQGWGRVDVGEVLDGTAREFRDQGDLLDASGDSLSRSYAVQDTGKPVKVTLAWTDPPGPASGNAFVNDLDLVAGAGGNTYKGNVFSGGLSVTGGFADPRNNVESVYLPAGTNGRLSVKVVAKAVAGDGVPGTGDATDQDFALVVSNADEQASPVLVHDESTIDDGPSGDGALEPGDSFDLDERVRNSGDNGATGVSGTLSPVGGDLSITQASSGYPDVAADGTATNDTPFAGSLSGAATCGADVQMTLDLSTAQGAQSVPVALGTGEVGPVTPRTSSDVPKAIPDNNGGGVASTLSVPTGGRIKDLDVRIAGITHTFVGDLKLELSGPDGTTVVLAEHPGGPDNSGNNFTNTVFDDEAATSISAGTPPYTGSFKPQADQLSRFDGKEQQGTWTLRVRDLFSADTGNLTGWGSDTRGAVCTPDDGLPQTTIDSGPSGTQPSTSATFEFSSNEPGSTFECKLDSGAFEPCSSPKQYSGVSQGSHTFQAQAKDPDDNLDPTPATRTWTVDTVAPAVTLGSPADGSMLTGAAPALSGTGGTAPGDSSTVAVKVFAGSNTLGPLVQTRNATRNPSTGAYSVAPSPPLADGTYTARAQQTDAGANIGFSNETTFTIETGTTRANPQGPGSGTGPSGTTTTPRPLAWALQAAELDLRGAVSKGVPVLAGCGRSCSVTLSLTMRSRSSASVTAGRAVARLSRAGSRRVTVRLRRSARRRLARARRATLRLRTTIAEPGTRTVLSRRLMLRRRGTRSLAVRRGVRLALRCSAGCRLAARVYLSRRAARALGLTIRASRMLSGRASARLSRAGTAFPRLRLTRAVRRRARRVAALRPRITVFVSDLGGVRQSASLGLVLRR